MVPLPASTIPTQNGGQGPQRTLMELVWLCPGPGSWNLECVWLTSLCTEEADETPSIPMARGASLAENTDGGEKVQCHSQLVGIFSVISLLNGCVWVTLTLDTTGLVGSELERMSFFPDLQIVWNLPKRAGSLLSLCGQVWLRRVNTLLQLSSL